MLGEGEGLAFLRPFVLADPELALRFVAAGFGLALPTNEGMVSSRPHPNRTHVAGSWSCGRTFDIDEE